jgi:hypothetical protein
MKKNEYIAPEVEVMELGVEMLLEASPVPVDLDTDAEDPALGREMNNLFF